MKLHKLSIRLTVLLDEQKEEMSKKKKGGGGRGMNRIVKEEEKRGASLSHRRLRNSVAAVVAITVALAAVTAAAAAAAAAVTVVVAVAVAVAVVCFSPRCAPPFLSDFTTAQHESDATPPAPSAASAAVHSQPRPGLLPGRKIHSTGGRDCQRLRQAGLF